MPVRGEAIISECGRFRYSLLRSWGSGVQITWVMLNPSTADADQDDPTIRKCIGFSKRWGYGSLRVVNLFALRSTDPRELRRVADPCGPLNEAILSAIYGPVIAAWGAHRAGADRDGSLLILVEARARIAGDWHCLGFTKSGEPRHPLMVPYSTVPVSWPGGL